MKRKREKTFSNDQVTKFWDTHDATEELNWAPEKRLELIYEPPVKTISLRLPSPMITDLKRIAAKMDIAYQALIKVWLSERMKGSAI